ncbi:MAG: thiamine diphosphokinase [Chloroflexi bacterium]|nr:thiamine diphosphokinase [Chloroflexota bacterium]
MLPNTHAVIIANGELHNAALARAAIHPGDLIIAADGGANHCRALDLTPRVLIGDLDSVLPAELDALESLGAQIIRYPARKDQTDLELALDYATANGATEITVIAALGGRWDQTLANLLLLVRSSDLSRLTTKVVTTSARIRLIDGSQQIMFVRGPGSLTLTASPGDTASLIPIAGDAHGVNTFGLEYPLENGILRFGSTLGISNVIRSSPATVSLAEGLLVCVVISSAEGVVP